MIDPEVQAPDAAQPEPDPRRNYIGWVVLAILFSLLVLNALAGALQPRKESPNRYAAQEMILRIFASQRQFASWSGAGRAAELERQREALAEPISEIVPAAKKEPVAARIYAVMRTEQGRPVPPDMLEPLRNSKNPIDQAYLQIYSKEKLTPEEAKALAAKLPDRPFSNVLAGVHAQEKAGITTARADAISPWTAVRFGVAALAGFGALFASFIVWVAYIAGRRQGKLEPLGHPVGRVTLHDADRLAIRAAQILSAFLILQLLIGLIARAGVPVGMGASVLLGLGILGAVILLAKLPVDGKRISLRSIGVSTENFGRNVLWGIAGFFAEIPVTGMLAMIGMTLFRFLPAPTHPATEALQDSRQLVAVLPILIFGAIVAPIWEEILFRGILFPAISRITARVLTGAIVSSLLFGLIHPQGPILVLALSGVGAMSCALAYQTRSLIPSIVMHMVHNSAVFTLSLLVM